MTIRNLLNIPSLVGVLILLTPAPQVSCMPEAEADLEVEIEPEGQYNYAEALQKAVYFYDVQRSGALPEPGRGPGQNRVPWRDDSALEDGSDQDVDLTGGFFDAGDHVKFGFPMAASMTMLAWGALEYREGFESARQLPYVLENLRWGADYLVKAHVAPNELFAQVGSGSSDHAYWGPPEEMGMTRPSFKISPDCPGSDLAAESAAALAAISLLLRDEDPEYARELLEHAVELYEFADRYRGRYSDCVTDAAIYYRSWSGYEDELVWGALWLYQATGARSYLEKAEAGFGALSGAYTWTQSWDEKRYGCYVLLSILTGKPQYRAATERWLDYWTVGHQNQRVFYTQGGLAWLDAWAPLRYAANTAFLAFVYSDWARATEKDNANTEAYETFAGNQINYILGNNPQRRSFMVGFGNKPPQTPHHRSSHGSRAHDIDVPEAQQHIAYGAMVGGPNRDDLFVDDRTDYRTNEVALDYNAALTGALARMAWEFAGAPLQDFPPDSDDSTFVAGL